MERKRPQSRKKKVTDNSLGIHKRGDGLGNTPASSTEKSGDNSTERSTGGSGTTRTKTRGPTSLIVILALLLFGGGGGLFGSGVLGGSSTGASQSVIQSLEGTSTSSSWSSSSNTAQQVDTSVADGSRAKRTQILGNGQDTVTIMVYMCGADLESQSAMATSDLSEMAQATKSDNLHIIVYTGGCKRWQNSFISSSVNQIYEVLDGKMACLESNAGTGAMTDPSTLTSFIQWCTQHYPANRNELIFWDHGGGSVSGYGYDEKNSSAGSMTLSGINTALKNAGTTFDFIGFDTCLMATVENALMLDDYADYLIASEETEPGTGWYYTNWVTNFSKNTSMDTLSVGQNIVDDFITVSNQQCSGQQTTLAVIDLAELSNTVPDKLTAFSNSVSQKIVNNGYKEVSTARANTREFAQSSAIDQVDLVHLAYNLDNSEGKALAEALLGAIKYNRTNISNAYGLSVYFPYRSVSSLDKAVSTYADIGMDESYSQCIREFASMEVSGQISSGGTTNPLSILLGSPSSSSSSTLGSEDIANLLSSFMSGNYGSVQGLGSSNVGFFSGRSLSTEDTASYISENQFDASALVWSSNDDGDFVISMDEDQWELVEGLDLNMFYDDGEGYIDLGLDNVFDFDEDGNLLAATDKTWLAINGQPVAYYHEFSDGEGDEMVTYGYVPAMLTKSGESEATRVNLIIVFDPDHPDGYIAGASNVYSDDVTETIAKNMQALEAGDKLDFLCNYYAYDGTFQDTYYLGETMEVTDDMQISNVSVGDGNVRMTYRFTDIYQQHYWSETITG